MKWGIVHTAQMLGHIFIEPGTLVQILDKSTMTERDLANCGVRRSDDHYLWVRSKQVDVGHPFTMPKNRVNIITDKKELKLFKVLFG